MAKLVKSGFGAGDTKLFSTSFWFRIPSVGNPATYDGGGQYMLLWGPAAGPDDCNISVKRSADTPAVTELKFHLTGHDRAIAGGSFGDYTPTIDIIIRNRDQQTAVTDPTPTFTFDTWYSLQFSADIRVSDVYDGGLDAPTVHPLERGTVCSCILNGVNMFARPLTYNFGNAYVSVGSGNNWSYDQNQGYLGVPVSQYTVPTWDMYVSGTQMVVSGVNAAYLTGFHDILKFEYADFQTWFGTYIDWTNPANYAGVVTISGGSGRPAGLINASNLPTRSMWFRGKASDNSFFTNQGNTGTFTKTGTVIDFTPGPSY